MEPGKTYFSNSHLKSSHVFAQVSVRSIVTIISSYVTRVHIATRINAHANVQSFRPNIGVLLILIREQNPRICAAPSVVTLEFSGPSAARKYLIRFTFTTGCEVQCIQAISNSSNAAVSLGRSIFTREGRAEPHFPRIPQPFPPPFPDSR